MTATCHPDREHLARGLCSYCYQLKYRKDGTPRTRQYKLMPEFEPDWLRIIPHRTPGVRQNAVTSFPVEECWHCHRRGTFVYQGREARCAGALGGCGSTLYLVRASQVPAEPASQPAPLMPA